MRPGYRRSVDSRDLECAAVLADVGHFGRAAQQLGIAQPSLSRRIAALEAEVGTALFERSAHGVRTTAAGTAFLTRARRALSEMEGAALDAEREARRRAGSVRVGFTGSAMLAVLPPVLAAVRRSHPEVRLEAHEASSVLCAEGLVSGLVDVAVTRGAPRGRGAEGLRSASVSHEHLVAVLAADHPLAGRPRVRVEQLVGEVLISTPPEHERPVLPPALVALGAVADSHVHNAHTLMTLVACGAGVGLGPGSMRSAGRRDVRFSDLEPAVALAPLVVSVRDEEPDGAVLALLEVAARSLPAVAHLLPLSRPPAGARSR